MRNALLATAAMAFVSSPALADDKMSVGVGGYMQNWFGYADRDDDGAEGGWAVHQDSEIHIKGSLESDMGLKYTVHVELEGDGGNPGVDESFMGISGEFGQIEFGARDHAMVRMHSGISDVGIGLTSGDTQAWVPGTYLETAGHGGTAGGGNDPKLNYITPRVSGLQVGVSYAPDDGSKRTTTPDGNPDATWGAAVNFKQEVGDMAVTLSLGHRNVDTAGTKFEFMTGMGDDVTKRLTPNDKAGHDKAIKGYNNALDLKAAGSLQTLQAAAQTSTKALADAIDGMATKGDAANYTNAGVGVGMGAFKFNVAYATSEGGAYKTMDMMLPVVQADIDALNAADTDANPYSLSTNGRVIVEGHVWDHDGDGCGVASCDSVINPKTGQAFGSGNGTPGQQEADEDHTDGKSKNDPGNDVWLAQKIVEDKSKDFDVWGVSVTYTDGPMAVSLGHMAHEADDGGERTATMLSASYTLAPGVAWKSSVFGAEDTTGDKDVTGGLNEGTGFVTGIALSF